jgi:hypothetical protein
MIVKEKTKDIPNRKKVRAKPRQKTITFSLCEFPAKYPIYKGTRGKTHGDKNDNIPKKKDKKDK